MAYRLTPYDTIFLPRLHVGAICSQEDQSRPITSMNLSEIAARDAKIDFDDENLLDEMTDMICRGRMPFRSSESCEDADNTAQRTRHENKRTNFHVAFRSADAVADQATLRPIFVIDIYTRGVFLNTQK